MQISTARARTVAVLGPTNTGKTHLAMERMLGHASGMIGFPLRLLARENYERAVRIRGRGRVALITGEEKIVPAGARWFLCTVESMPVDRRVAFLGIDEVQMCADPERGHIFTERLLGARGTEETMFMGAETIRPLLRKLVPDIEFMSRPRFSTLSYTGDKKINRLAARSAVVAFSAADVYAIAEQIRRQRGGAAVVLGALSPRTRNAQVGMYQAGEVDYLVATDAIGMGLNMDVDHVAFAATRKFDGRSPRRLTAPELAQIAGRAGRHMNDGTFGTTAEAPPIEPEVAEAIQAHRFDALRFLYWRNPELRFATVDALLASLDRPPPGPGLIKARPADDLMALTALAADPEVVALADHPENVRLLWEVCRIPDFRKVLSEAHTRLLGRIYRHLRAPGRRLPTDWVARQVRQVDRTDGDIEALVQRISNIRTWTYVAYQGGWLDDAEHWQGRTRAVEDRLSDALHDRLTQRFVDRRTAVLVRRMKDGGELAAVVRKSGEVLVEGHAVGQLDGFRFVGDQADGDVGSARTAFNAALRALRGEAAARIKACEDDKDSAFTVVDDAVLWRDAPVARLGAGPDILRPMVEPLASDLLEPAQRDRLRRRLAAWLEATLAAVFAPLRPADEGDLTGAARGIAFQLAENMGSLPRAVLESQIAGLGREDRKALRARDIRLGRESVYLPALLKPAAVAWRCRLWCIHQGFPMADPPPPGRVSLRVEAHLPAAFYEAVGFRVVGPLALRLDILERLSARLWTLARGGAFPFDPGLPSMVGGSVEEADGVLKALGYRTRSVDGQILYGRPGKRRRPPAAGKAAPSRPKVSADSPFAKLKDMLPSS